MGSVYVAVIAVAILEPFRKTSYPATPILSVDGLQVRVTELVLVLVAEVVAERLAGTVGGLISLKSISGGGAAVLVLIGSTAAAMAPGLAALTLSAAALKASK